MRGCTCGASQRPPRGHKNEKLGLSISKDIERTVQHYCCQCQLHQSTPPVAPLQPWCWPTRPWAHFHLNFADPVQGKMILVLIDAHSKWIEAIWIPSATSAAEIKELRTLFIQFGHPATIVTNNGTEELVNVHWN